MRPSMLIVSLAAGVLGGSSGAYAQGMGVEIYPGAPYSYSYRYADPAPRVYRYRSDAPAVTAPVRPASCGEFRYWNGERCVDARIVPPDLR